MKKFLAFLMAALMLLSVAVAEGTNPDTSATGEEPAPSPSTEVQIEYEPTKDPEMEAVVTRDLFALDENPEAVAMAAAVLEQINSDDIECPVDAFNPETRTAVLEALGVEAEDVTVPVAPIAMLVNDEVANTVDGDQMLILSNVPVNSKFVIVLSVKTGDDYDEIVLTDVDSDPTSLQVYAKVDVQTLKQLCAADVIIATVLTVRQN